MLERIRHRGLAWRKLAASLHHCIASPSDPLLTISAELPHPALALVQMEMGSAVGLPVEPRSALAAHLARVRVVGAGQQTEQAESGIRSEKSGVWSLEKRRAKRGESES